MPDVNTEIENLKNVVVKVFSCLPSVVMSFHYQPVLQMIKAGQPVFFGSDVGKYSDTPKGIMDTALYEYEVRTSH
jgi:bleomycin hydrolase